MPYTHSTTATFESQQLTSTNGLSLGDLLGTKVMHVIAPYKHYKKVPGQTRQSTALVSANYPTEQTRGEGCMRKSRRTHRTHPADIQFVFICESRVVRRLQDAKLSCLVSSEAKETCVIKPYCPHF